MTIPPDSAPQPLVSVVVPTFGCGDLLEAALRSVLAQSFVHFELIVVDDGTSPPVALPDALSDPRLRLLRHERNRGAAAARNTGVAAARAPWIAFLDADDLWREDKLERQLAGAVAGEGGLVAWASGFRMTGRTVKDRRALVPAEASAVEEFASGCWFCPGSTLLVRKDVFDRVGPFDERLPRLEDYDWFLRFARASGMLRVNPEVLADIRVGGRPSPDKVRAAAALIRAKYVAGGSLDLGAGAQRRLTAYLALEEAACYRNAGAFGAMALALARSFVAVPRARLHLGALWRAAPDGGPGS
jgi:glycosyltransferase involved in cell wall biosynthesis